MFIFLVEQTFTSTFLFTSAVLFTRAILHFRRSHRAAAIQHRHTEHEASFLSRPCSLSVAPPPTILPLRSRFVRVPVAFHSCSDPLVHALIMF
ncbi:hypothetical protein QL285_089112 [Trifolium repens]|nr:hypothetical protein QL285_089112 [Trifolium repens]